MILKYRDLGEDRYHRIKAEITTEHSASHYGLPVIVLEDGNALDLFSWVALGYQIVRANKKECVQLKKIFANFEMMLPPQG
jgi:hypothetical protein